MHITERFVRYFVAGGIAATVDIGLFMWLTSTGIPYLWAGAISFVLATTVNFIISTRWVFPDRKGSSLQKAVGTYIASGVGLAINQLILWLAIEKLAAPLLLAKLLATGIVFFWNFLIRNLYVFRNRPH